VRRLDVIEKDIDKHRKVILNNFGGSGTALNHIPQPRLNLVYNEGFASIIQQWLEQSLKNVTEEPDNMRYAYIREEDMTEAFPDQTVITVKIPKDVQMELPPGEQVGPTCSISFL